MIKAESFGIDWLELPFPFPVEIHHLRVQQRPRINYFKVLNLATEPGPLRPDLNYITKVAPLFDMVLTSDERLMSLENATFIPFGNTWLKEIPRECDKLKPKEYSVSFLFSMGSGAGDNISLRYDLWTERDRIPIQRRFFTSVLSGRNPTVEGSLPYPFEEKDDLFRSMFSIIIENQTERNFFSEKLVDCMLAGCVPIYKGCPNIGDYFLTDGIISFDTVENLIYQLGQLTPTTYEKKINSVLGNRLIALNYSSFCQRAHSLILDKGARTLYRSTGLNISTV